VGGEKFSEQAVVINNENFLLQWLISL